MCPHRGAVFSYYHRHETYPYFKEGDQLKQSEKESKRPQPYDGEEREGVNIFFVWEMLRPLLRNITLYVITNYTIYDPPRLCTYLEENKITRILVTPSLLETVINTQSQSRIQDSFNSLRSGCTDVFQFDAVVIIMNDITQSLYSFHYNFYYHNHYHNPHLYHFQHRIINPL